MSQKIAVITGASRGLGRNTALHLAQKGVDSILTYHTRKGEADEVVSQIEALGRKAVALQLDAGDSSRFKGFAEQVGERLEQHWQRSQFNFLVNNAGFGIYSPFADTSEEQFDQLMNIQFKGVFFITQALLPLIADKGRIINISSGLARFSLPGYAAYAAMKGAIEVLTRYLAKELGPRGISVNTVAPGAIETDFGGGVVRDDQELNGYIASQTALGRVGKPDDIGGMIAALLAPENNWINGQRIEVSGGIYL